MDNLESLDVLVYGFAALCSAVIYWLLKKIFKNTNWSIKSTQGLVGYILLAFQLGTLFQHYFLNKFLLKNPEGFFTPGESLEIFLRFLGIFVFPTLAKIFYFIQNFKHKRSAKLARFIMFLSPVFLLYLSFGSLVKQIPANDLNCMYLWVGSLLIDLYFAFFSSQWPVYRPQEISTKGWFLKRYFRKVKLFFQRLRVWGRRLLPIILALGYINTMYGDSIDNLYTENTKYCIEDENHQVIKYITYKQYINYKNPGPFRSFWITISLPIAPLASLMPKRYLSTRIERVPIKCPLSVF